MKNENLDLGKGEKKIIENRSEIYMYKEGKFILPVAKHDNMEVKSYIFNSTFNSFDGNNKDIYTFSDLINSNKFFDCLTAKESIDFIIQRPIDIERVEEEIVNGYLKDKQKSIKFFPNILAVLVPMSGIIIEDKFNNEDTKKNEFIHKVLGREEAGKLTVTNNEVDGIYQLKDQANGIGFFAWDKSKVSCIILDGQHRITALEKYLKDMSATGKNENNAKLQCNITIQIINLHEFMSNKTELKVVDLIKEIFLAINRSAISVEQSTFILMDQYNPTSVLLQDLLKQEPNDDWQTFTGCIDYECKGKKFEEGYITGTLLIHTLISEVIFNGIDFSNEKDLSNPTPIKKVFKNIKPHIEKFGREDAETFIEKIITKLEQVSKNDNDNVDKNGKKDQDNIEKFSWDKNWNSDLVKFLATLRYCITQFFTEFEPFVSIRKKSLERFKDKYGSDCKPMALTLKKLYGKDKKSCNDVMKENKELTEYNLLYTTVGQLCIFQVIFDLSPKNVEKSDRGFKDDFDSKLKKINNFYSQLNKKEPNFWKFNEDKNQSFWEGIILKDGKIQYNNEFF